METLLCQKVCKITTNFCTYKINSNDYQSIAQKQTFLGFSRPKVPLSVAIFYGEPHHKRIFTSIGARLEYLVVFKSLFTDF